MTKSSLKDVGAVGTLVVLGLGYRTGQAGGGLVYRHGAAQASMRRHYHRG